MNKSRQAWYERSIAYQKQRAEETIVLDWVAQVRIELPRLGVHKMYHLLKSKLLHHKIRMGRDKLWKLLQRTGNLVPRRKRKYPKTTFSFHRFWKWPFLIGTYVTERADLFWVADITYIRLSKGFAYLSLISDAYSKMVVGYFLHSSLEALGPIEALRMALKGRNTHKNRLIHHSDRGFQYCSHKYVGILQQENIRISMTQSGEPTENAVAERMNGILKEEMGLNKTFVDFEEAETAVVSAIFRYNYRRPHASCNYLTPAQAHRKTGIMKKKWYNKHKGKTRLMPSPGGQV